MKYSVSTSKNPVQNRPRPHDRNQPVSHCVGESRSIVYQLDTAVRKPNRLKQGSNTKKLSHPAAKQFFSAVGCFHLFFGESFKDPDVRTYGLLL